MDSSVETKALRERKLESEKAQRIVAAMRECVGTLGAAGATFDRVAQLAGVSRGLLHYYFGSKERLLVEVVRHDTELRLAPPPNPPPPGRPRGAARRGPR